MHFHMQHGNSIHAAVVEQHLVKDPIFGLGGEHLAEVRSCQCTYRPVAGSSPKAMELQLIIGGQLSLDGHIPYEIVEVHSPPVDVNKGGGRPSHVGSIRLVTETVQPKPDLIPEKRELLRTGLLHRLRRRLRLRLIDTQLCASVLEATTECYITEAYNFIIHFGAIQQTLCAVSVVSDMTVYIELNPLI